MIPTVDTKANISTLPKCERYVIKPKSGADSIGLEFLTPQQLHERDFPDYDTIIQPSIDFLYEVSFYFINDKFEYALYAPDTKKRWELKGYSATAEDIEFARKFIDWNSIHHGIQRIDACRTKDGGLLLMELEDLNPFLSFECLDPKTQNKFIADFSNALQQML